jgi:hypothetical protein
MDLPKGEGRAPGMHGRNTTLIYELHVYWFFVLKIHSLIIADEYKN